MRKDPEQRASAKELLQTQAAQDWAIKLRLSIGVSASRLAMTTPLDRPKQEEHKTQIKNADVAPTSTVKLDSLQSSLDLRTPKGIKMRQKLQ